MKNKTLLGILIILIAVSAIFSKANSADVNQITNETKSTTNAPKDDLIYSNRFLVKGKTISRIAPKTSVEDFRKNIEVTKGKEIKIYKGEKEITNGYIGTGMLIKGSDGQEYTTSVTGDLIGNGMPSQIELTMIIRHLIDLKEWQLEGIEKTSSDITGDGKVNLVDVNKLINYIVYQKWEKEEIKTPKAPTINVITKKDENKDYYIGEVEIKIEEDKSIKNAKTTYIITGSKEQKETEIKEGEIIKLKEEGEYLITAYTYGIKGNKSKGATKLIKVIGPVPNLTEKNTIMTHTPTEWTKLSVTVSIQTTVKGYILQYSKDGVKWEDYTKEIEMTQNGKIYARLRNNLGDVGGKVGGNIVNIDKALPTVTLTPNGGDCYTMPSAGNAKINAIITAIDAEKTDTNGCSGLKILQYAWSESKDIEPEAWKNFTNGSKVEKTDISKPGTWYLWTKVIDKAGNIANTVKVSDPFVVKSNEDPANRITLTPDKVGWTNENVTVSASFGKNLVQNKSLICSGTAETDYTVNGVSNVVVKTNGKTVTAIARDIAGNTVGKELKINNIDRTMPAINSLTANPNGWTNGNVTLTGKAMDSQSGIVAYQFSQANNLTVASSGWTNITATTEQITETKAVSLSGTWYFYVKDALGNLNKSSVEVKIDKTAPTINNLIANPGTWTNGSATLTGKATDSQSGIVAYQFSQTNNLTASSDGWTNITGGTAQVTATKSVDKEGTWYFYVKDAVGNVNKNSLAIKIDKTVPTINNLTANPNGWTNGNVTLTGKATDGQSGIVAYQFSQANNLTVASSGWTNITATTAQITETKAVSLSGTWYFYVKDAAGNVNKNSVEVKIDKTGPIINSLTASPAVCANKNVTLTGKATDNQSGIVAYQFSKTNDLTASSNGWTNITGGTTQITQTKEVSETGIWYFYAKDAVGNVNKKQIAIIIDKTAPIIEAPSETVAGTTVEVKVTDVGSGVGYWAYSTNSNTPTTWTEIERSNNVTIPFTPSLDITTETRYYIFVKDLAGNVSSTSITVIPARWHNEKAKTSYTTLEEALLEANNGDTLKLLSSYDDSSIATVSSNKTITLNTNGKTLTKSVNTISIDSGSALNINGNGTIKSISQDISLFFNCGTLNMNEGTISSDYGVIWNQGNFNMKGGTLTGGSSSSGSTTWSGILIASGNVNVSGGSILCGAAAIELRGNGNITITGASTVVRGGTSCSNSSAIYCTYSSSGIINIGTTSSQNKNYPHIIGIDNQSTNVKVNIYSGKVD